MAGDLEFFKQFLYEAPGDDPPPDMVQQDNGGADSPPDLGGDDGSADSGAPPDLDGGGGDGPPDMGGGDDFGGGDDAYGGDENQDEQQDLGLDAKVSAIMNVTLYQRFLQLLGNITSQITQIKENSDVLYSITTDCTDILEKLNKLKDNVQLYLTNQFANENYSKNLLFFNKCLNLLALLNDCFDNAIKKGIKSVDE